MVCCFSVDGAVVADANTTQDQGVSKMIAERKVKLKHGTIKRFVKNGIEFEDGTFLPADVVVCATG